MSEKAKPFSEEESKDWREWILSQPNTERTALELVAWLRGTAIHEPTVAECLREFRQMIEKEGAR